MFTYEMKFRLFNPNINLLEIKEELQKNLEAAKKKYNLNSVHKKGVIRTIKSIEILQSQQIFIVLESNERLLYPSKAISNLTKILVDSDKVKDLLYNKRLFVCDESKEILPKKENLNISDAELICILDKWILIPDISDTPLVKRKKRYAIEDFKNNVQEILTYEENAHEDEENAHKDEEN